MDSLKVGLEGVVRVCQCGNLPAPSSGSWISWPLPTQAPGQRWWWGVGVTRQGFSCLLPKTSCGEGRRQQGPDGGGQPQSGPRSESELLILSLMETESPVLMKGYIM